MNKAKLNEHVSDPMQLDMAVMVIEPDLSAWQSLEPILSRYFRLIQHARTLELAVVNFRRFNFDLVVIDIKLVETFWQLLNRQHLASDVIHQGINNSDFPILDSSFDAVTHNIELQSADDKYCYPEHFIVLSRVPEADDILAMMRKGAKDFISKPIQYRDSESIIANWCKRYRLSSKQVSLQTRQPVKSYSQLVGDSSIAETMRANILSASVSNSPILIEGLVGTGKKLATHQLLQLADSPCQQVVIDCRDELQLTKTALAGCDKATSNPMRYVQLVLTHVDSLSVTGQIALMQLLDSVSLLSTLKLRVVSLSHSSLLRRVQQGAFSSELYHRLACLYLHLPPLNQRSEDIVLLVKFFVSQLIATDVFVAEDLLTRFNAWRITDYQTLTEYDWPGNIQELKNTVEQCLMMNVPPNEYFKQNPHTDCQQADRQSISEATSSTQHFFPIEWDLKHIEKAHILRVMNIYQGNKLLAAEHLNISRKTIDRKLNEWAKD
ncbi:sigma-54-dependent transcriptional regulator [Shewanella sp. WPAGA9]|uniref:sigma-54-dependent transcriptional regulator n=1 Tax=Shewanella sp. ENK2 TaxID=2775245 RepID=UPI00178437C4|nr:sigma 54-interacting transcriptional regulator [Shewanella sp. WPAGA9]